MISLKRLEKKIAKTRSEDQIKTVREKEEKK